MSHPSNGGGYGPPRDPSRPPRQQPTGNDSGDLNSVHFDPEARRGIRPNASDNMDWNANSSARPYASGVQPSRPQHQVPPPPPYNENVNRNPQTDNTYPYSAYNYPSYPQRDQMRSGSGYNHIRDSTYPGYGQQFGNSAYPQENRHHTPYRGNPYGYSDNRPFEAEPRYNESPPRGFELDRMFNQASPLAYGLNQPAPPHHSYDPLPSPRPYEHAPPHAYNPLPSPRPYEHAPRSYNPFPSPRPYEHAPPPLSYNPPPPRMYEPPPPPHHPYQFGRGMGTSFNPIFNQPVPQANPSGSRDLPRWETSRPSSTVASGPPQPKRQKDLTGSATVPSSTVPSDITKDPEPYHPGSWFQEPQARTSNKRRMSPPAQGTHFSHEMSGAPPAHAPRSKNGQFQRARRDIVCGWCSNRGHYLADCSSRVDSYGYVCGCPRCNTLAHDYDDCARKRLSTDAMHYLVHRRHGKPMIKSKIDVTRLYEFTHAADWGRPHTPAFARELNTQRFYDRYHEFKPTRQEKPSDTTDNATDVDTGMQQSGGYGQNWRWDNREKQDPSWQEWEKRPESLLSTMHPLYAPYEAQRPLPEANMDFTLSDLTLHRPAARPAAHSLPAADVASARTVSTDPASLSHPAPSRLQNDAGYTSAFLPRSNLPDRRPPGGRDHQGRRR